MIIIPILSFLGFSCFFSKYFKVKLNHAIPITISILVTILYCCAILNLLMAATYLLYFIGILLVYSFYLKNRHRFSYESLFFTLVIFAFFLYTREASLHAYDDFSHWGIFTKELLYSGVFENQTSFTSIISTHAHYPRGAAVYHYFMLMLSGYSDGNVLFAHFLLHLMFLAPLASNKKIWQTGLLFSAILCAVVLYTTGLRSIYNDSTIGLMFGATLGIYILEEDKKKALKLIIPIAILLPLFREIGAWLASFASIILILHYTFFDKKPKTSHDYITYVILLTLPILCNFILMDYFRNTHDFLDRKEHSFSNLIYIVENFNEQHKLLLLNYGKFLLKFLVKEGSLVVYTICFIAWYGIRKYKPKLLAEYKFFLIATFICGIIFALWRLYLYFFTFSYEEAIRGASLLRYLGCYVLGMGMVAAAYVKSSIFLNEKQSRKELCVLMLLFAVFSFSVIKNILRIKHLSLEQKNFIEQAINIKKSLEQGNEIVFNFSNKKDNLQCYILNYNLAPYLNKKYLRECLQTPKGAVIDIKRENIYVPFL
ncbi:hypothetical protein [Rickettsia bellii]|uniref:Putative membrane protein n=1 Tax=Rickettsia bellii str. RML Mogi TaxID=1359194 RepID=A0A0F3QI65_RICBE|nr:hypothetical protein [Rickettsia bellii]KJV91841.1 putative membrane protein [Rickettsia bellii str. RML Mogi]